MVAEKRLKEKRKEAIATRASTDAQWKDLGEKEAALGKNFKKFNKVNFRLEKDSDLTFLHLFP